jgi:hypothetical protein
MNHAGKASSASIILLKITSSCTPVTPLFKYFGDYKKTGSVRVGNRMRVPSVHKSAKERNLLVVNHIIQKKEHKKKTHIPD